MYRSSRGFRVVFSVLFIALIAGFAWYFINYQQLKEEVVYLSSPEAQRELSVKEIQELLAKVEKLIVLPTDEEPVVATVQDAESLAAEQAFFEGAIDGDKLLVYSERAIIYSPERDILVNVGPIYIEGLEVLTVDVRNGSSTGGAAGELGDRLDGKYEYEVVNVGDASNFGYEETVLVNLSGVDVSVLEQELGVTAVTKLPAGEADSEANVVVIVGGGVVEVEEAVVVEE